MNVDASSSFSSSSQSDRQVLEPGIYADRSRRCWALVTEQSSYMLGVTEDNLVVNLFWGGRLASFEDISIPQQFHGRASQNPSLSLMPEEYPASGSVRYGELAAKATFSDGTRDLDLRFVQAKISTQAGLPELQVQLHDAVYPLTVTLFYRLDTANDLVIRSAAFHNEGTEDILLERVFSAVWHLPTPFAQKRRLTTLAGHWAGETRLQQRELVSGTSLLESRKGVTGDLAYPWFAIDEEGLSGTEVSGDIYFGTLAWSGSWTIRVTTTITGATAITGGIHDYDFAWKLHAGSTFTTPDFVAGFASDGFNGSRRRLHRYIRAHVLPQPQASQPRPVLYNSWEATGFNVTEEGQIQLAERAAQLGVELFVVDDGWFPARVNDFAGLGDWRVDPQKFPRGLKPLVERVHELGMEFGLWVEPEMVNPDSDLYRAHPDWVYHFPTRPRTESRNQLVLNVGREDVQQYLLNTLDALIRDNGIEFIKWDMNRPISEPGWPEYLAQQGEVRELWVRHTYGVYAIMDGLRQQHPGLSIESCSSGGGRADLGVLRRTDQVWTSDNTHPDARLFIQEGASLILPGRVMGAWVTDTPSDRRQNEIPLSFRFHVAMLGMLGIGGHLTHWSDEDMQEAARWIAVYKQIRPLVQDGDQYWLALPSASQGTLAAIECVDPDAREAVIFAYRRVSPFWEGLPLLRLQHLRADTQYRVSMLGEEKGEKALFSGTALMNRGIELPLQNRSYESCIVHLQAVE